MAKKQFKAESKRLLDMMINSIYTHKEIFLREIISNASDAVDKLCYVSLTEGTGLDRTGLRIRVYIDPEARTVTVSDNGIGMTKEELESNLGVIARSGSLKFKGEMDNSADSELDIIGQFGVGFYSAFMVSDRVEVLSRAHGSDEAWRWVSEGADGYTITEAQKESAGSDVIMHIKPDTDEEHYSQYLESSTLLELVKKYSDYIRWPIIMDVEHGEWQEGEEKDEYGHPKSEYVKTVREETVNSMVPIWQRTKSDASDEDCKAFYKERFHDRTDPAAVVRINAEGQVEYRAMLFVPENAPYDFYSRDFEPGLQLYSSGVMIMERCADLLPEHFRFVRGVVDSPDLSLNISRELLQHDRQLRIIATNIEKRIRAELKRLMDENRDEYVKFWQSFGRQIKIGMVAEFGSKKEQLQDLLLFDSSIGDAPVSLKEYVDAMPEGQKHIYYASGENRARAAALPQTEQVRDAGFPLLYLTEDTDEFVIQTLGKYADKELRNVATDELELESDEEKKENEELQSQSKELLDFVKESLGGAVSDVRLSRKLKSSPVCLSTEGGITLEMERYFASMPKMMDGQEPLRAKRVLEINPAHSAFGRLETLWISDKERAAKLSKILLVQAELMAGLAPEDPVAYAELVCELF